MTTVERGLVVDPMCGSGTAGDAARELGRRAILSDHAPEYVSMSADRMGTRPLVLPASDTQRHGKVSTSTAATGEPVRFRFWPAAGGVNVPTFSHLFAPFRTLSVSRKRLVYREKRQGRRFSLFGCGQTRGCLGRRRQVLPQRGFGSASCRGRQSEAVNVRTFPHLFPPCSHPLRTLKMAWLLGNHGQEAIFSF
jgi:hypothetical protein